MAFEWKDFDAAVDMTEQEIMEGRSILRNRGFSLFEYVIHLYSNQAEEGYEEAYMELRDTVVARFHKRVADAADEEAAKTWEYYEKKARKMAVPNWLRRELKG